jgi:hypothetical protein
MLWAKDIRQEILRVNPEMGKLTLCILVDLLPAPEIKGTHIFTRHFKFKLEHCLYSLYIKSNCMALRACIIILVFTRPLFFSDRTSCLIS